MLSVQKVPKIAVTGTKGKTTVTNLLAYAFRELGYDRVLHVNTTGHFINGERRSTFADSTGTWGLVPTVSPGRYLFEFLNRAEDERTLAVLETSVGCSTLSGLGYAMHHVGIFLNVFEDHIGSSERLKTQHDILEAKRFIVSRIKKGGTAVLNFDDVLVRSLVTTISEKRAVDTLFFGRALTPELVGREFPGASFVTVSDDMIRYYDATRDTYEDVIALSEVTWTFHGAFEPSIYNLMAIIAGVIAFEGSLPRALTDILARSSFDRYGGRLTSMRAENGAYIIADYAHEKHSLVEIAKLARKLCGEGGKVIGVVRLAYDRTDDVIHETGRMIAPHYDHLIVYDKIDGHFRQPKELEFDRFTQEVGKISRLLVNAIAEINPHSEQILREDHAIARAAETAGPEDVVVVIVNDDIRQSIEFIQEKFAAKFI